MIIITDKDTILDEIATPSNLIKAIPHYQQVFEGLRMEQEKVEEAAVLTNQGKHRGGPVGFKRLARMPEPLLTWLLVLEPNLLRDGKTFKRFMRKHPQYGAYVGQNF